jgi:uncharacterized protein YdaU (DUF1376 family)
MAEEGFPMLPWFPGDFMRSTRAWPLEARGCYRELLDAQWDMGFLPADTTQLREIVRATVRQWNIAWSFIEPKFPLVGAGRRQNWKLERIREDSIAWRFAKQSAGRLGGLARAKNLKNQSPDPSTATSLLVAESKLPLRSTPLHSTPNRSRSEAHIANVTSELELVAPVSQAARLGELELIRALYPKRAGGQRWPDAEKAIGARRREGTTWDELVEGVKRYAHFCRESGKERTELVQQAATFFGKNKGYAEPWDIGATKSEIRVDKNIEASQQWLEERRAARAGH